MFETEFLGLIWFEIWSGGEGHCKNTLEKKKKSL